MCTISCVKLLKKFETSCRRYKSHLDMQHLFGFVFQKKSDQCTTTDRSNKL